MTTTTTIRRVPMDPNTAKKLTRAGGLAHPGPVLAPAVDRVVAKVAIDEVTGCWNFTGTRNVTGYGMVSVAGRGRVTHRVTYEHFVGPVPEGLQLDHLCNNRACCNPDHLEPVTAKENVRRAHERRVAREGVVRPPCGTRAGYQSHRRHGEVACRACKDAQAAYARQRTAARREATS